MTMLTPTMQMISVLSSMFVVAVLVAVIMRNDIKEGVVIKIGLIFVCMSLLASLFLSMQDHAPAQGWVNAGLSLRVGLAITCAGIVWRAHLLGNLRRSREGSSKKAARIVDDLSDMLKSDWADLDDKP
ncbi:hypothetical protein KBW71_03220 [Hydrogenophaga aromaticivorans]|uniref:hypothetical protein n=1 Tax=Hydrogenophaga aromaticivorans TaxID=2610898 RepID=UPI001B3712BF|nr:hypothetical protein [Hydrogenophaga aromaticivorans]MBQ0917439.1 hypothetical protein [Hydrogenophaga aromaticivorans]